MITARTLVRFVFAGLFVNALAVACVVSDGDDDDDTMACDPGTHRDCTCANGDASQKTCSVSGNGYGACECDDATTACEPGSYKDCACANGDASQKKCSANGSGYGACQCDDANVGGAGGGPSNYGGEAGTSVGGAGGGNTGGMMSVGGAGGAGGAGGVDDLCVLDENDDCQSCVQVECCAEWTACSEETAGDCQSEFFEIMACAQDERATRDIKPEDLEACAEVQVDNGTAWSDGLLPTTKALIDCVGGGQDWENRAWNSQSCNALCFLQE